MGEIIEAIGIESELGLCYLLRVNCLELRKWCKAMEQQTGIEDRKVKGVPVVVNQYISFGQSSPGDAADFPIIVWSLRVYSDRLDGGLPNSFQETHVRVVSLMIFS
jgi:hypothetical protein